MSGHGHSHGAGGCGHEHGQEDLDLSDSQRGNQFSLYLKIDLERVTCLNEAVEDSGRHVFKPWDQRLNLEKFAESDADEELLFNIPFTGNVKLKGIIVKGGEGDEHPALMKVYKNRPNMTFDDAAATPDQEFELTEDPGAVIEYRTKVARFNAVQHLSLYFPSNFGAETTKVYYIGLRGDFTEAQREAILITTYEAQANPADHKQDTFDSVRHEIQ